MNLAKVVVSLGLILTFSILWTACGGSKSTPPPPAGAPTIQTAQLPQGAVNEVYGINGQGAILSATGGTGSYTWSIASGNLPAGLSLNGSRGVISGTPTAQGTSAFTVQVTDAANMSSTASLSIYIEGVVSITPMNLPSGSVGVAYVPQTLSATGGLPPYTWSVASGTLPAGLTLNATTGVISGTPTTNGSPATFTVQVTDSETSPGIPAVGSSNFTITIMSITTASLPNGFGDVPYSGGTVTVAGGSPPYSWCVVESSGMCDNGSTGALPPGLSLDPACTLTKLQTCAIKGTPTQTGNYSPTFQVTDGEKQNPAVATAQLSISIVPAVTNANLNGNYVFSFSGYNNGKLVVMAGGLIADGNGNITSGVLDYNDGGGEPVDNNGRPIPQTIQTGSVYSITPNGLGTMTITTNTTVFNLAISIRNDGSGGSLIQSDPANPQAYGSGILMNHTQLSEGEIWPLCGSYVSLGLFGLDPSLTARYAAAGEFQYSPQTCVDAENGVLDINDGGVTSKATFTAAFNQYDNTTSRGIVGMTFNSNQNQRYFNPFYLISSSDHKKNQLVFLTENVCDPKLNCPPTNPTLWSALPQVSSAQCPGSPNRNNYCLNSTAVAELNAVDTKGAADVTAGLFASQGVFGHTCTSGQGGTPQYDAATFSSDENQGGTCNGGSCGSPQSSSGTFCIDTTTGRVTLQGFSGSFDGYLPVFYVVGPNQAFVVGSDPGVTAGYLEFQSGSSFTNASLLGLYEGGTITPNTAMVTNAVSWLYADGGSNMNGTEDTSGPGGPGQQNFTYTYGVDNTGRTLVCASGTCNASSKNIIGIAYVVSATKFVLLPATDPNPALSVFSSGGGN